MESSRRHFLLHSSALAVGFAGLHRFMGAARGTPGSSLASVGYGPLAADPEGIVELPKGFRVRVISRTGETMDDGLPTPGMPDGMAAFPIPGGDAHRMLLVRNHELEPDRQRMGPFGRDNELLTRVDPAKIYDRGGGVRPAQGGTSTLVFNSRTQKVERHFLSLAGTVRNCAGGPTPWGSWLTCEEDVSKAAAPGDPAGGLEHDHGYVFEVPATTEIGLADPTPIRGMGRFYHEAVAVDPRTGVVYLTEDRGDGLIYRYVPSIPGRLRAGGKLQALTVWGKPSLDTRNWDGDAAVRPGASMKVAWIDMDDLDSPKDDLRDRGFAKGAARFARGEGMWHGHDAVYFCCTNGGRAKRGQVWKLTPGSGDGGGAPGDRLELFIEPDDDSIMNMCDNITVAPWGDLVLSEDGTSKNRVLGVTPEGRVYELARSLSGKSEIAGVTFSPDGTTLFFNLQQEGLTLALTGPWRGA